MVIVNITSFINRKSYIYSIGDVALPAPIALSTFFLFVVFFAIYTLPMFLIFGFSGIVSLVVFIAPPVLMAIFATKPIFGEKTAINLIGSMSDFWFNEPRAWYDGNPSDGSPDLYEVYSEVWVSRMRELQVLADIIEGRNVDYSQISSEPYKPTGKLEEMVRENKGKVLENA